MNTATTAVEKMRLVLGLGAAAILGLLPWLVTQHFAEMFVPLHAELGTVARLSLAPWFTPSVGAAVLACTLLARRDHRRLRRRVWEGILLVVLVAGIGVYCYGLYAALETTMTELKGRATVTVASG